MDARSEEAVDDIVDGEESWRFVGACACVVSRGF